MDMKRLVLQLAHLLVRLKRITGKKGETPSIFMVMGASTGSVIESQN